MKDVYQIHDAARVRGGKYAGLVGCVIDVKRGTDRVRLHIEGVSDDAPVTVERWFSTRELERNQ